MTNGGDVLGTFEEYISRDLITTECDLNEELARVGLARYVGDRFTRASFGQPRFDVSLPFADKL